MLLSKMVSWIVLLVSFTVNFLHSQEPILFASFTDLAKHDRALIRDLNLINYPPKTWKIEHNLIKTVPYYDVAIIGAGMAGLTAGTALFKEGIFNIKIFDQNSQGFEGPWKTFARMKTLRSNKDLMGPALDIPHLTFHAWFESQWGAEAWEQLNKISNDLWMEYLNWYRQAMQLPIENDCKLITIIPMQDCFELEFQQGGNPLIVKASKVILATGLGGFGGASIPEYVKHLPKSLYAHTSENIDFDALKDKSIGIIGVGASAFDAAAVALEKGAKHVDLLMRRKSLPNVNKFTLFADRGFSLGYYSLTNEKRWKFMRIAFDAGTPPPTEALKRLQKQSDFRLRCDTTISSIDVDGSELKITTNQGILNYDFLILSTGVYANGHQRPELRHMIDQIALWLDRLPPEIVETCPLLGNFPYLGPSFEFLPKETGTAPYLKHLYCFNYSAILSHGLLSTGISAISTGATRLAQGIAADFFIQYSEDYLENLKNYQEQDFDQNEYFPLSNSPIEETLNCEGLSPS